MTTPGPTVAAAAQPWDENRWREVLRNHKPFSPKLRATLEHLYKCIMAHDRAYAEYQFEAAMSGAKDASRLRVTARRLAKARHEALTALGQDPKSADIIGFAPTIPDATFSHPLPNSPIGSGGMIWTFFSPSFTSPRNTRS